MNQNDFTCIDAQSALASLIRIDPSEIVDLDSGVVTHEWTEEPIRFPSN